MSIYHRLFGANFSEHSQILVVIANKKVSSSSTNKTFKYSLTNFLTVFLSINFTLNSNACYLILKSLSFKHSKIIFLCLSVCSFSFYITSDNVDNATYLKFESLLVKNFPNTLIANIFRPDLD